MHGKHDIAIPNLYFAALTAPNYIACIIIMKQSLVTAHTIYFL
jgi:hypothetical protein